MGNLAAKTSTIRQIILLLIGLFFSSFVFGQTTLTILNSDSLSDKRVEYPLTQHKWSFLNGDDHSWSQPVYPDKNRPSVMTNFGEGNELAGWRGIGWFRLWIEVDTGLTKRLLGLRINHDGASEIYIDGKYKGGYGTVSRSKAATRIRRAPFEVLTIQLTDTKPHLIAIRYANYGHIFPDFIGFQTWIGDYDRLQKVTKRNYDYFQDMRLSSAAQLSLALLHLFLFLFYPKQKLNLYYVLFSLLFIGTNLAIFADNTTSDPLMQLYWQHVFWICGVLATTSSWHLLYTVGGTPIPKWKTIGMIIFTLAYLVKKVVFLNSNPNDGFNILFLFLLLDGLWALIGAIRRGKPYVWLIGLGMAIIVLLYFFVGADVFHLWRSLAERSLVMSYSLLSFPILFSIYLALDFARTNQNLSLRLVEVEELSIKALAQETEKLELITNQAERLERTVAERTAQVQKQADQLQELDELKSRFFINLTHEFRTPLTLILGPAKQIQLRNTDSQTQGDLDIITNNAERLLRLINQLLDLSKLEAGKMELNNTAAELISLVRRNVLLFQSLAEQKDIHLAFQSETDSLWLSVDQSKMEDILYNLLSNALKFTKAGGFVTVDLLVQENNLHINVSDTGVGIPPAKIPYIFDRFYQVDSLDTRANEGTGIGLAITKELTELMGGQLRVKSRPDEGTTFTVSLPMHYIAGPYPEIPTITLLKNIPVVEHKSIVSLKDTDGSPLILVVEDNVELRRFIMSILTDSYQILEAANGEDGLKLGLEHIPDLVITDVMMPLMNGYQLCEGFKNNEKTSHIPVLMLTAKTDTNSKLAGLETQADAYLTKPFDQRELLATIINLIRIRRKLQERYKPGSFWLPGTSNLHSMEQVFIDKIKASIEAHLEDELYSVDELGNEIGLSRTQLHRKLKGLTGQGPGELIRSVRLQRAFELLKQKAGTISEIGYMVGFGNPNNFSTSFSKYFGFPPSEAEKH